MDIKNIYDFYLCKIIKQISTYHLTKHPNFLKTFNIKVGVFDYCGKLKQYGKYFYDVSDCWIIENDWENDIADILKNYDLIYFFEDYEDIDNNIFYTESFKDHFFIFILFLKGNFKSLEFFCC